MHIYALHYTGMVIIKLLQAMKGGQMAIYMALPAICMRADLPL